MTPDALHEQVVEGGKAGKDTTPGGKKKKKKAEKPLDLS
jgi:hypothetical protein